MSLSVYLVAVVSVAAAVYYYLTRYNGYWKKRGIVGPDPSFFFGTLKDLVLQRVPMYEPFEEMYLKYPNEKLVGMYRLRTPILLIRDLDLIQHVMIRDFDKFLDRITGRLGAKDLGQNLAQATGDQWRMLRSRLTPIFTSGKLKNMFYLIDNRGDSFLEYLDVKVKEQPERNVYNLIQKYTVSTISSCAFGIDVDLNEYNENNYATLDKEIFCPRIWAELEFLFPGIIDVINIPFPKNVRKYFFHLIDTIVKERNGKSINRGDFMDLLLDLRNAGEIRGSKTNENDKDRKLQITDTLLAAQCFVFYAGGYETSATTMSYLLHELSLNPEIQDRLVSEINLVLEKYNGKLSYDALQEMTYMDQVFDEVLRMYPIVDPLQRHSTSTYKVPGTDLTLPKRTLVVISVHGIHYDEKYYPEPHKFNPDRFSPENAKKRHPCAYMPFGLGPRNCIGMRFAKVQSKVLLAKLLPRYRAEPARATRRSFVYETKRTVLGSKYGVPLRLVRRE